MDDSPSGEIARPRAWVWLTPLAVLGLGHLVARTAQPLLGGWAWVPVSVVQWSLFAGIAWATLGRAGIRTVLAHPQRARGWTLAAIVVGLLPLPIFAAAWRHLTDPALLACWLGFALVNPLLEELYWRSVLVGPPGANVRRAIAVPVATAFYALNHPVTLGVFSLANAHPATTISTLVLGLVWSLAYLRSGSLRGPWLGHTLTDLLNLSVVVFLNLYVPPTPR